MYIAKSLYIAHTLIKKVAADYKTVNETKIKTFVCKLIKFRETNLLLLFFFLKT